MQSIPAPQNTKPGAERRANVRPSLPIEIRRKRATSGNTQNTPKHAEHAETCRHTHPHSPLNLRSIPRIPPALFAQMNLVPYTTSSSSVDADLTRVESQPLPNLHPSTVSRPIGHPTWATPVPPSQIKFVLYIFVYHALLSRFPETLRIFPLHSLRIVRTT